MEQILDVLGANVWWQITHIDATLVPAAMRHVWGALSVCVCVCGSVRLIDRALQIDFFFVLLLFFLSVVLFGLFVE